jgi:chromosome segregation ATPase
MKTRCTFARFTLLGLSLVMNASTPAQKKDSATQESAEQTKKRAEAQKKAAEAKEKWTKAQENIRNKEAELAGAKQQQEEARLATRHAQEARHKLKQPMPSTAN